MSDLNQPLGPKVTTRISREQRIGLIIYFIKEKAPSWSKIKLNEQIIFLLSLVLFMILKDSQIKRVYKTFCNMVQFKELVGKKMCLATKNMGAGCQIDKVLEIPFAKHNIISILSELYHFYMNTAPKCILPTEFREFLHRCDDELERQLQNDDSYNLEMNKKDIVRVNSFVNFTNLGLLSLWEASWIELRKVEKLESFITKSGLAIADIDFVQNNNRYKSGNNDSKLLIAFTEVTYINEAIVLKATNELYTDDLFHDSPDNYVPDIVELAQNGDRKRILNSIYRTFEQFAYDAYKKTLILHNVIDEDEAESYLTPDVDDNDELKGINDDDSDNENDVDLIDDNNACETNTRKYTEMNALTMFLLGADFRFTVGILVPDNQMKSDDKYMHTKAIQILTDKLLISLDDARNLYLPIKKIEERGHSGGIYLLCICERILDAFVLLENEILIPMLGNIRKFTAVREGFIRYVRDSVKGHESYDDMIELFESTLLSCSDISSDFIKYWVPKLVKKLFDYYLRVVANDFITKMLDRLIALKGPTDRLSFRLQVLTNTVKEISTDDLK